MEDCAIIDINAWRSPVWSIAMQPPRDEHLGQENADPVIITVFVCALAYSVWVLIEGWSQPILDMYGFRQTQTAITVFWLSRGGPLFDYLTPVLGAPWKLPFEFPLFQWIVAAIYKWLPIELDSAGRIVSYLFFVATLWPLHKLFKLLGLYINQYFVVATLFLLSPIYLFWSRTFMIESTALFFSVMFVASMQQYLTKRRYSDLVYASVAGSVAALVKITTFPAFVLAAGILVARDIALKGPTWNFFLLLQRYVVLSIPVILPVIFTLVWVGHADGLKAFGPLNSFLTSSQLTSWNYGTFAQRLSGGLWHDVIFDRSLRDALGNPIIFWISMGAAILCSRRSVLYFSALFALYISSFLFFTNLHIVHSYYQYANAMFIVLAVAYVLSELRLRLPRWAFTALFIATSATEVIAFIRFFEPALLQKQDMSLTILASRAIKQYTPPDSAIFVFGLDWSSEIPYYSQRKAVAFPDWTPRALMQSILAQPTIVAGDLPVSAVVSCTKNQNNAPLVKHFLTEIKDEFVSSDVNGCTLFIKDPLTKIIGTELKSKFKVVSSAECLGYIDDTWRTDIPGNYGVAGWAWDVTGHEAPHSVLLADATDHIRGIVYPILPREDVRRALPVVKRLHVGWRGYANMPEWPLAAYSLQTNGVDVCRLGNTRGEPDKR